QVLGGSHGRPAWFRQGHVEERFLGDLFVRPRGIHGGGGEGAHEGRRLLEDGRDRRGDRHDVVLDDEVAQAAERVAKGLQQSGGGGVVFLNLFENLLRGLLRVELRG